MNTLMSPKRILIAAVLLAMNACTVALPPERLEETTAPAKEPAPTLVPAVPSVSAQESSVTADKAETVAQSSPRPRQSSAEPIENIVVTASSLSGYWRLTASSSIDVEVGLLSGVRILYSGAAQDRDICRIRNREARLSATCVAGFTPTAEGSLDQQDVTLRWWSGPANVIFRGT